jgi:hypothetical protein
MAKPTDQLYAELKDDVAAVANPLFDLSERLLRENGNFLPHGFVLNDEGKDAMVGAVEDNGSGMSTSTATLPLLHQGLRKNAETGRARAVGVAEHVTVTPEGGSATKAIKVLFEHREGLCVALYLPFKKRLFGGYEMGTPFTVPAEPEVKPWRAR